MSLINTFALIDDPDMQIPGGLVVTRTSHSSAQDQYGRFPSNPSADFTVAPIMVHEASGRDLQQLPEADRQVETIKVYTKVRLYCDTGLQDFIAYRSRLWKITRVEDYSIQGNGYVCLAQLKERIDS
jgi:hypothetical protein